VGQPRDDGVSATLAAFISAVVSIVLTIAGTLVSLRSSASQTALFLVLTWLLITASIATGLVAVWLLADRIRKGVRDLAHLRDLEAYVPQLIRFRHRHDTFVISGDGNATLRISCDVESPNAAVVPWISFPMIAEVPPENPAWTSVSVLRVSVDGVESDPTVAFIRRERKIPADPTALDGRLVESGAVRVPVSLDPGRTRCSFTVELELCGAFGFVERRLIRHREPRSHDHRPRRPHHFLFAVCAEPCGSAAVGHGNARRPRVTVAVPVLPDH
jgi:hypothetical protein